MADTKTACSKVAVSALQTATHDRAYTYGKNISRNDSCEEPYHRLVPAY